MSRHDKLANHTNAVSPSSYPKSFVWSSTRLQVFDNTVMSGALSTSVVPVSAVYASSSASFCGSTFSSPDGRVRTKRYNNANNRTAPKKTKLNNDGSVCRQGVGKKHCKCGYHARSNRKIACPNCGSSSDWIKTEAAVARAHRIKTTVEKRKCATPLTMRKSKKTKHVVFHECDNILPTSTAARDALSEFDSILESCVAQDTFELELNAKERALNELEKELAQEKERILGLMTKLNVQAEHLAKKEAEIAFKVTVVLKRESERKKKRKKKREEREKTFQVHVSAGARAHADAREADAREDLVTLALGDDITWPNMKEEDLQFDHVVGFDV